MKSGAVFLLLITVLWHSCSGHKDIVTNQGAAHKSKKDLVVERIDTFDYSTYIKYGNDKVPIEKYRKAFHNYKDSINLQNVLNSRINRYGFEDPFSVRMVWNKYSNKYRSAGFVVLFTNLAKSGDKEAEAWLLDFFDRYIDEAIAWNNKYSDGPEGLPELYYKPMRRMLQWINRLPPSKEKIRLYQKLAGQETGPCHTYSEDVGCTYGDNLVFNGVSRNIADMTYRKSLTDEKWEIPDNWEKWTTEKLPTLIEDILNDKIVMIDRETWKRR